MTEFLATQRILETPSQVSAISLSAGSLFVGSVDGSLRQYDTPTWKVTKAIRNLGEEISSIAVTTRSQTTDVWVACGANLHCFSMNSSKMILTPTDARNTLTISDDVLNELDLNSKETYLAFGTDSGSVGVVDLAKLTLLTMKTRHESICGSIKFIPDRPRELVSGGYDTALLHFDFEDKNVLSRHGISNQLSNDGMSMSPPFILAIAMSQTGVLAAGTADGQLWIGLQGEKLPANEKNSKVKSKRSRKWEGLKTDQAISVKAAEGPIVAMTFYNSSTLLASTLQGTVICYDLERGEPNKLVERWRKAANSIQKVNALVSDNSRIILGGITSKGKGCVEICMIPDLDTSTIRL